MNMHIVYINNQLKNNQSLEVKEWSNFRIVYHARGNTKKLTEGNFRNTTIKKACDSTVTPFHMFSFLYTDKD